MNRQDEWTRESEADALDRLRAAAGAGRQSPIVLVYTRSATSMLTADHVVPHSTSSSTQSPEDPSCSASPSSTSRTPTARAKRLPGGLVTSP